MKTNDLISMSLVILIISISFTAIVFIASTEQGQLKLTNNKMIVKSKLFTIEIENTDYELYSKIDKNIRYSFTNDGIILYYNLIEYRRKITNIKLN